ncbi:hypothetical protein HMF8227_01320 [Saliniradius amylolyticus]|uniref:PEP-CTERM protein-sorting domain-containing protein n=1 Tax=Saliniradius amylolyticus TaxID=2183582 RepID=A0A2S2E2D0_9ALTE|nr:PEP-CTERM sorting domain-containing protein [Saliniradius amylolyticus]AWL11798.1 hypothetical protein HMF8227_01320 [Saliniradius amylolyticus]
MYKFCVTIVVIIAASLTFTAKAGVLSCDPSKVTLNTVALLTDLNDNLLQNGPYDASQCLGYDPGNDDQWGLSNPTNNIGQYNDGLLNGEGDLFDGLEFIEADELQVLGTWAGDPEPADAQNDPGWIHLLNFQWDDELETGSYNYSSVKPNDNTGLFIGDLLEMSFDCADGDCTSADWSLTVKLDIIEQVQAVLGDKTFDHLAFSVKAGTGFAVYDFDFIDIFNNEPNPALNFLTPYAFTGTLNTMDLAGKGVSHINVWARDPADTTTVPEPWSLALLALGLLMMGLSRWRLKA